MTSSTFVAEARDHDKCVKAGNEAAAFWMWAIQWSNKRGTDGFLDESILHKIPPVAIQPKKAKALAEACADAFIKPGGAGLFERVEGGYTIHDFHDHKVQVDESLHEQLVSTARSLAGRQGASKRWQKLIANDGKPDSKDDGKQSALPLATSDLCQDGSRAPSPSGFSGSVVSESALDPIESLADPDRDSHRARSKRRTAIRADWVPSEADVKHAAERGWSEAKIAQQADRFRDYHLARHTLSASWGASWRTWVANDARFGSSLAYRPGPSRAVQPAPQLFEPDEEVS